MRTRITPNTDTFNVVLYFPRVFKQFQNNSIDYFRISSGYFGNFENVFRLLENGYGYVDHIIT